MKYYLAVLGLTFVLAACSDADDTSGSSDMAQLTIDVTETGWHGETVNVSTRSGETLEELKAAYPARNWNLASIPGADITALYAATSLWTYDGDTKTYTSATAFNNTLKGGDGGTTELSYTADLIFSAASGNIHIVNNDIVNNETDNCISFTGVLTIPNLKAGQTVTIELKSPSGETRTMQASNVSGSPVVTATTVKTTETRTVANNGSVTFTAAADINIYSISVSKAEDEGFGIYCSELNYTNTQVTWDNVNSKWLIDEHNYNTYWQRNETGTINVYAYAPYKAHKPEASPTYTVVDNKLTFVAQKHSYKYVNNGVVEKDYTTFLSGGNVDLLQANASISRSSNEPAQLTFNHKLAKLTFGTITNNTGETIQLNGYTVKGTLNSEAVLDLTNGKWESHTNSVSEIQLPPPFVYVVHTAAEMAGDPPAGYAAKALIEPLLDKQTTLPNMTMGSSILLIPNADGKIVVTVEVNNSTGEKFSFPITLEEGKEKIVNITIGRNFEVVITE